MDTPGLHVAFAYHQIPPAKLIFLQPELHREVHAFVCLYDMVIEGPGDEREEEGEGQETETEYEEKAANIESGFLPNQPSGAPWCLDVKLLSVIKEKNVISLSGFQKSFK